jgi:WD40 repeat protein
MRGIEPPTAADAADGDAASLSGAADHFGLAGGPWAEWQDEDLAPGTDLGGFVVVRLVGRGGMGVVYEARQIAPPRTVALKVIRAGLLTPATLRRFEQEARVLARLQHPHVAQIHASSSFASARGPLPFIVMELVAEGRAITEHFTTAAAPIRTRVTAFHKACAAVAHGHAKGVIHRDIKPGNILVDEAGMPKVIDFGVARPLDPDATTAGGTSTGDVVGTLRYMSPEQLGAAADGIDARTDVYALGLVLHELVTGALPYELRGKTPLEAARILDGRTAASTAAVERAVRAEGRRGGGDGRSLAAIVAKCLEPRPSDRYSTAAELEADVGRWLAGDPVLARPLTAGETLMRLARRHRAAAVATGVIASAVVVAAAGMTALALRAESQRRLAEARRLEADRRTAEAREQLYVSHVLLAAEARDRDNLAAAGRLLAEARGLATAAGTRHPVELDCLAATLDESSAVLPGAGGTVTAVGWSPDGRRLAAGAADGTVRITDVPPTAAEPIVLAGHDGEVWDVAFSPDGRQVATASADGTVRVYDSGSGRQVALLEAHGGPVYAVAFSPDGTRLATASRDRTVRLWEPGSWREEAVLAGHAGTVYGAAFDGGGRLLATASQDGTVRIWDVATGRTQAVLEGHGDRVFGVAFSPDGRRVASGSADGTARVWDAASGASIAICRHPFRVNAVAFVEDGERIATASGDGLLRVWDAAAGREAVRLRGHAGRLWSLAVAPRTARAATGADDGTMRIWDLGAGAGPVVRGAERMLAVAVAADGGAIAIGTAGGQVLECDAATFVPRETLDAGGGRVNAVAYAADGRTLAAAGDDGRVRLWSRPGSPEPAVIEPHARRVYSVAFSADGARLVTAAEDRTARVWDRALPSPLTPPLRHPGRVFCAVFAPDGRLVATACEDRVARLWDVAAGEEVGRCTGHEAAVNWVAFAPQGGRMATASSDGTVRLWSVPDCRPLSVLTGPARQVWKVAFSSDGARVAAVSADGTAQLWDAASGRAVATLRGHGDQVWGVAFPPDGRSLLTASWDGTARLWGVSPAEIARRRAAVSAPAAPTGGTPAR